MVTRTPPLPSQTPAHMDRDRLRLAVLAVLAIVGTAAAAATIDDANTGLGPGRGGEGVGTGSGGTGSFSFGLNLGDGDSPGFGGNTGGPDPWRFRWVFVGAVAIVLSIAAFVYWRQGPIAAFAIALALSSPLLVFLAFLFLDPSSGDALWGGKGSGLSLGLGGEGGGGSAIPRSSFGLPTIVVGVLGLVVMLGAVLFYRSTDDDEIPDADEESDPPTAKAHLSAIGTAAGRAADRIEDDEPVNNEVYRAWREMTDLLEIERPASTTPREFAETATAAGMNDSDVETLTDLFRQVRYGERAATDDRTERALEALRRIERTYADPTDAEGSDAATNGPGEDDG